VVGVDIALGILAVLLLIAANGFYVAGEFALVTVDRNRVESLAETGDRRASSALEALRSLSFQLSGAQLGITVTSLLVGFIVEPTIGRAIEPLVRGIGIPEASSAPVSIALALVVATAAQMVFAELVPKNLAIARPLGLALAISGSLRLANALVRPVVAFLNAAANATVRLLGLQPSDELRAVRSLEEIQILLESSHAKGSIARHEFALLSRSISFGGKNAGDALVPRTAMETVEHDTSLSELTQRALTTGYSRFPVTGRDIDDIVGIAHIKDIYEVPREEWPTQPVRRITRDALVAPESRALEALLIDMRSARKQMAVVIDEYGGTAGIITLEDLVEEIVGDIEDEYDPASGPSLTASPDGVHVVSGMLHIDEVAEITDFRMPEGDYETLAGFLLTLFDRIPAQGEHVSYGPWEFKVVEMENRRISKVLMVADPVNPDVEPGTDTARRNERETGSFRHLDERPAGSAGSRNDRGAGSTGAPNDSGGAR
jgi:CBS domain containing-hemolysin-like protein